MATTPLGGFANLSRYQQAAVQPQANVLDQFVQALNQGISLAQLPQTLQAEAQQRQQQSILNAIRVATAQKQFEELNKTPEQRLAERFQENLIAQSYDPLSGVGRAVPGFEGEIIATPGAITPEQQNLLALRDAGVEAGAIPLELPTVPLGTPIAPVLTPRGVPTGFSMDAGIPATAAERAREARLTNLRDEAAATAAGKQPSEIEKIRLRNEGKVGAPASLRFEKIGNTVIAFHPVTGAEVSRTNIPADKIARTTPRGLWIGTIDGDVNDPASGGIVPGTEPIEKAAPGEKPPKPLNESQRNSLLSLTGSRGFLSDALKDYDKLNQAELTSPTSYFGGKVGPLAGRVQSAKAWLGFGDKEFKAFDTRIKSNLFQSARALQGAGVLTEKDITRMEEISPTTSDTRDAFIGGINGMKQVMLERAQSFRDVNYSRMNPDEQAAIDDVIIKLTLPTETGIAPSGTPPTVTTKQQYDALPPGSEYIGKNGKPHRKP